MLPSSASYCQYFHHITSKTHLFDDLVETDALPGAGLYHDLPVSGQFLVIVKDDVRVHTDRISDVYFVEHSEIGVDEDVVVLPDHIVSLGGGDDDDPHVGSQGEVRGTDEVPDVLDEKDADLGQVDFMEALVDHVRIQMALLACVAVGDRHSGSDHPVHVVGTGDVTSDGVHPESLLPELLSELDDQCGLPCTDGAHEVNGNYVVFLEHLVVLVGDVVVLLEDVELHADCDVMHVADNRMLSY